MVSLSTNPGPKDITFYIQNTGIHAMDESSLAILVDGVSIDVDSTAFVPAGGVTWGPNMLLEVTLEVGANDFTDGQEISIYAIARSEIISGISTSATMNEEVRLNEE
jgi:archaellum component FlaG (FlaF/FlaG flagellin family)